MDKRIYTGKRENFKIIKNGIYNGYHFIIVSYGTHPCAYVELPENHPYYEMEVYDDEPFISPYDKMNIRCHYGLTFAGRFRDALNMPGYYIGWDYAHLGDMYYIKPNDLMFSTDDKFWEEYEIEEDCRDVIEQLFAITDEKKEPQM